MQQQLDTMVAMHEAMAPTSLDPPAYLCCGGVAMLPVRPFAAWLGAEFRSEGDRHAVRHNGRSLSFAPGDVSAKASGGPIRLPKAPRVLDGATYVPLRPLVESLGGKVLEFDTGQRMARVSFGPRTARFRIEKRSPCPAKQPPPEEDKPPDWWQLPGKPSPEAVRHRAGGCTMIGVRCSYVGECGG
jgi:hypothetical protein